MNYTQLLKNGFYKIDKMYIGHVEYNLYNIGEYQTSEIEGEVKLIHPLYEDIHIGFKYSVIYVVDNSGGNGYIEENFNYVSKINIDIYDFTLYYDDIEVIDELDNKFMFTYIEEIIEKFI